MLDLRPLAYFLPAFLRAAIVDPNSVAAEMLVYFICSRSAKKLYEILNSEQRDVFNGVIAWLLENDHEYFSKQEAQQFAARLRERQSR